jgi:hypothetical protein
VRLTASDGGTEEEEKGQDERGQERERHREGKTQRRKATEDISPSRPRSVESEAPVYLPLLLPASASQSDSHELAPLEDAEV